jgi:peptidylprolyl isomerase domain and WD repeat-containing protein 1
MKKRSAAAITEDPAAPATAHNNTTISNNSSHNDNRDDDSSSDDDDDFGPMPVSDAAVTATGGSTEGGQAGKKKKARKLEHERLFLENLPTGKLYEHSFMHRDVISHIVVSKATEFVVTASVDGHVKFWKKMADNVEFVKHFQAHIAPITAFELSPDGRKLFSAAKDRMLKFFDVQSFDIASMITVEFTPSVGCWLPSSLRISTRVAVADENSGSIFVFSSEMGGSPLSEIKIHSQPVRSILSNSAYNSVISADSKGMIEYWDADTFELPTAPAVSFRFKSETDLYDLAKSKTWAVSAAISPNGKTFAIFSRDKQMRIFDFRTGKLRSKFDESAKAYQSGSIPTGDLDPLEIGNRIAVENELESLDEAMMLCKPEFDESGNFLVRP